MSEKQQRETGLPKTITTKKDVYTVLRNIRNSEKAFLFSYFENEKLDIQTRSEIQNEIYRKFIEQIETNGAKDEQDGYLYALWYITKGGKYMWYDKNNQRGVKSEMLATGGNGKTDRKYMAKILNDKTGISPEIQAENIRSYDSDEDDYYIKNGILEAIQQVSNQKEAYTILAETLSKQYDPFNNADAALPF